MKQMNEERNENRLHLQPVTHTTDLARNKQDRPRRGPAGAPQRRGGAVGGQLGSFRAAAGGVEAPADASQRALFCDAVRRVDRGAGHRPKHHEPRPPRHPLHQRQARRRQARVAQPVRPDQLGQFCAVRGGRGGASVCRFERERLLGLFGDDGVYAWVLLCGGRIQELCAGTLAKNHDAVIVRDDSPWGKDITHGIDGS